MKNILLLLLFPLITKAQPPVSKMLVGMKIDTIKVKRLVVDTGYKGGISGRMITLLEVRQAVDTVYVDGENFQHINRGYLHLNYLTIYKTPLLFTWQVWEPCILPEVAPLDLYRAIIENGTTIVSDTL